MDGRGSPSCSRRRVGQYTTSIDASKLLLPSSSTGRDAELLSVCGCQKASDRLSRIEQHPLGSVPFVRASWLHAAESCVPLLPPRDDVSFRVVVASGPAFPDNRCGRGRRACVGPSMSAEGEPTTLSIRFREARHLRRTSDNFVITNSAGNVISAPFQTPCHQGVDGLNTRS